MRRRDRPHCAELQARRSLVVVAGFHGVSQGICGCGSGATERKYLFALHIEQGPQAGVKPADSKLESKESNEEALFTEFEAAFLHDRFHFKPERVQSKISPGFAEGQVRGCNVAEGLDSCVRLGRIQGGFVDKATAVAAGFAVLRLKSHEGYFTHALGCQQAGLKARHIGV